MAKTVRSNAELESHLPLYEAKISDDYDGWLLVTCPREECGYMFLVERKPWTATMHSVIKPEIVIHGRPCPYCHRVSRIPKIRKRRK
jgi:hypothetical protein